MTVWFISLIVHLGIMIMIVAIVITLASRIIEIFMYLSIAPIPMATMMDGGEWSGIGKNWIKQLLALSFQGFFIIVALGIFKTLFANMIATPRKTGKIHERIFHKTEKTVLQNNQYFRVH